MFNPLCRSGNQESMWISNMNMNLIHLLSRSLSLSLSVAEDAFHHRDTYICACQVLFKHFIKWTQAEQGKFRQSNMSSVKPWNLTTESIFSLYLWTISVDCHSLLEVFDQTFYYILVDPKEANIPHVITNVIDLTTLILWSFDPSDPSDPFIT